MVNKDVERGNGCNDFPTSSLQQFKQVPYHPFLGGLIGVTHWEEVWITELEQKNIYVKEKVQKGWWWGKNSPGVVKTEIRERKMEKYSHWSSEHNLLLFVYSSFFFLPPR